MTLWKFFRMTVNVDKSVRYRIRKGMRFITISLYFFAASTVFVYSKLYTETAKL
jgi:hypothetical protein